jgi:non-heme chloroperoxidase
MNHQAPHALNEQPRAAEMPVTSCDGHVFVSRRTGTGTPIVLLHDMTATQDAWDPVRQALSWSNTVITWDARGHGNARGTPESAVPTLDLLAADVDAALNNLGAERPVLVGHGLGALTILEYLRNYDPQRVSRVVLVDQSPRMLASPEWRIPLFGTFDAASARDVEAQIRAGFAEAWSSLQRRGYDADGAGEALPGHQHSPPRRPLRPLAGGSMLALWRSMIVRDFRADLAALPVPLLAVLGGSSHLYDAALLAQWFQDSVPGAHVVRYPKADHAPHAAAPARFARDVAAFATRQGPCSVTAEGGRDRDIRVRHDATVHQAAA